MDVYNLYMCMYIFGTYENTIAYKYDSRMNFDVNSDWSTHGILSDDLGIPRNFEFHDIVYAFTSLRTYIFAFANIMLRRCAI